MNEWRDEGAAWPIANPVVTCASLSDAGFPSNFVADPFLYVQVIILLTVFILVILLKLPLVLCVFVGCFTECSHVQSWYLIVVPSV
jgi:hypothetical protein